MHTGASAYTRSCGSRRHGLHGRRPCGTLPRALLADFKLPRSVGSSELPRTVPAKHPKAAAARRTGASNCATSRHPDGEAPAHRGESAGDRCIRPASSPVRRALPRDASGDELELPLFVELPEFGREAAFARLPIDNPLIAGGPIPADGPWARRASRDRPKAVDRSRYPARCGTTPIPYGLKATSTSSASPGSGFCVNREGRCVGIEVIGQTVAVDPRQQRIPDGAGLAPTTAPRRTSSGYTLEHFARFHRHSSDIRCPEDPADRFDASLTGGGGDVRVEAGRGRGGRTNFLIWDTRRPTPSYLR